MTKIYTSNASGDFEIISRPSRGKAVIRFINTQHEKLVSTSNIYRGEVKDPYHPSVHGIGYLGEAGPQHNLKAYTCWAGMLERCYTKASLAVRPTYKDVTVCSEWHCFSVFLEWFNSNYIEGYVLDKDKNAKDGGAKIYSPETCVFIEAGENSKIANSKNWKVVSPEGQIFLINNLHEFCREHSLDAGTLSKVARGKRTHHKKWKAENINE